MELAQIEKNLEVWHERKYGRANIDIAATIRKFGEECGEFMEAVYRGHPSEIATEANDVLFVMAHLVREHCGAGAMNAAAVEKIIVIFDRLKGKQDDPEEVLP